MNILFNISKYCAHDNWCKFILILRHFWIFQQFEESNFWSVPQNTALLDQYLDRYLIDLLKNRTLAPQPEQYKFLSRFAMQGKYQIDLWPFPDNCFQQPPSQVPRLTWKCVGEPNWASPLGSPQSIYLIWSFQHLLGSFKPRLGISMSKQAQLCPQSHAGQNNTIRYDEI